MPIQNTNSIYHYPKGWLITAFRNLRVPPKDHPVMTQHFRDTYKARNYPEQTQNERDMPGTPYFGSREVAYGNYDRIQITPVENLYDFTRVANQTHDWLGSNQSILLYKWRDDNNNRCFWSSTKEDSRKTKIVVLDEDGKPRKKEFSAVTFCYLSDSIRSRAESSYENLLDRCEKNICGLVDAFNFRISKLPKNSKHNPVAAEVFGSLSAAEVVILWSAKQYTDVMYLIDCVRDFECHWKDEKLKLFRTTYTLITFPDAVSRDDNIECWEDMRDNSKDWNLSDVQGEAQIMFATQDGAGEATFQGFKDFFNQCIQNSSAMLGETSVRKYQLTPCAGEYDLLVKVPSRYVTRLFCNPQIWHKKQDSEWMKNPTEQDAACSVYHPTFNQYILYSFTRLTYRKNLDLPEFARGRDSVWNKTRKLLRCIGDVRIKEAGEQNSQKLNEAVEADHMLLDELLKDVRCRIPRNSNLSMELNQLFNDYAQCMCASADGLWIADYRVLYTQILEQLRLIIRQMDARRSGDREEWADMDYGAVIEDFNRLILALHKQTNHITTSSKQLFREQETHFGYTAQHDLVLHAYYDMVKHLMQVIYSYSDQSFQSVLYPLVNFHAGDHIKSRCYFEEGAKIYLKTGAEEKLRPRVIVIDVPLDGMDNLMYYIPMMVHEVFHYAAPQDRSARNRMLAKISVYLALDHSLACVFKELFQAQLEESEKRKPEEERRPPELLSPMLRNAETQFRIAVMGILGSFVETYLDKMYQSLKDTFFTAELESLRREDFSGLDELPDLKALQKGNILRSWFLIWLENWLCGGDEASGDDKTATDRRMLSDFFEPLFQMLSNELEKLIETEKQYLKVALEEKRPDYKVYIEVLKQIKEQIDTVLNSADKPSSDNEAINQRIMMGVLDFIESGRFDDLMLQLDEIFPDIAMATLTDMPASGYMLQIALDLDRKAYLCNNKTLNDIRFLAILHWLINRQCRETGKGTSECLEQELQFFRKLYCSSYKMIAYTSSSKEKSNEKCPNEATVLSDANRWSNAFQYAYDHYSKSAPMRRLISWIDALIQEQMLPCLQMMEKTDDSINRKRLFQEPYNAYLTLLREKEVGEEMLGDLFHLSIQTVLRFQRYQPLRQMNEEFPAERYIDEKSNRPVSRPHYSYRDAFTTMLTAQEDLLGMVQNTVNMLYRFRKQEGVSTPAGMWYRGVSNANYTLLPSGLVHFAEDAGILNGGLKRESKYTYLDAQRHNYETFRYSAEGSSPDVSPAQYQCTVNYLALMQHYSQHTNLMDWSENFFAATYFALEEQIKLNDCYPHLQKINIQKGLTDANANAALYILDPVRFNLACQKIEQEFNGLFDLSMLDSIPDGAEIPNLSIPENQNRMWEYHELYPVSSPQTSQILKLHNPGGNTDTPATLMGIRKNIQYNMKYSLKPSGKLPMHLPRAVYAAKLNARIRAQNGLFIAYSLLSPPVIWENKEQIATDKVNDTPFHYQGLEQIQEYYLQMNRTHRPFLLKIKLPKNMKQTWGMAFYRLGLSTERIYPELQNSRNR